MKVRYELEEGDLELIKEFLNRGKCKMCSEGCSSISQLVDCPQGLEYYECVVQRMNDSGLACIVEQFEKLQDRRRHLAKLTQDWTEDQIRFEESIGRENYLALLDSNS